jgi:phosphomannomutase
MRHVMEWSTAYRRELIDGVKVFIDNQRSVLVAPIAGSDEFMIVAEADREEEASELGSMVAAMVEQWRKDE